MRDSKGRFIHGHKCLTLRDKTTGRFIPKKSVESKEVKEEVECLESKVDRILQSKRMNLSEEWLYVMG